MKNKSLILIFTLLLGLIGCNEEETPTTGKIRLSFNTTSSTIRNMDNGRVAAANDLVFTEGKITIREIVFDGENTTNNTSVTRTIQQVATIDYSTGAVTPEILIEVPMGDYTSVNLGIEMQDDGAEPSTVIQGTYTNTENVNIPVRFEFNSGEVFEASAAATKIDAGEEIISKITFDAIEWFSVVSVEQLENATLTEGVMVISATSNQNIFDIVADRLDVSTQAVFQ